jgi:ParB family chromosome partitioning protein
VRLLDLPDEAQKAIEDGTIREGHGRAILLAGGEGARRAVFRKALRDRLSVRATEDLARTVTNNVDEDGVIRKAKPGASPQNSVEIRAIEDRLQRLFQTKVRLRPRRKGGQILIEWYSNDDLERIMAAVNSS